MIDWEKEFSRGARSLSIQNCNPAPSQGSRNIYADDKPRILAAAHRHGYKQITSKPIACFVHPHSRPFASIRG